MERINKGEKKPRGSYKWICICWIWSSGLWRDSFTVAQDIQLLGLWTEGDVNRPPASCLEVPWSTTLLAHFIPRQPRELGLSEAQKLP